MNLKETVRLHSTSKPQRKRTLHATRRPSQSSAAHLGANQRLILGLASALPSTPGTDESVLTDRSCRGPGL